jgi:phage pi2 protein 07
MAIPIIVILIALLTPKKKETDPSPYDYKKDKFDGIVWRWNYYHNKYENRMEIENLVPFCPKCDCQLRIHGNGHLGCPNCGFEEYNFRRSESDLRMLIYHQIRQRYFPDR